MGHAAWSPHEYDARHGRTLERAARWTLSAATRPGPRAFGWSPVRRGVGSWRFPALGPATPDRGPIVVCVSFAEVRSWALLT